VIIQNLLLVAIAAELALLFLFHRRSCGGVRFGGAAVLLFALANYGLAGW